MAETIQQQLREWLDESSTAVRYDEYQQSWRDHLADATAQASALLGIADRTRPMHIGVLLGNTPDMLTALTGVWHAGSASSRTPAEPCRTRYSITIQTLAPARGAPDRRRVILPLGSRQPIR